MEHYQEMKEIILSWERCMQNGLNKKTFPGICLKGDKLRDRLEKIKPVADTFEDCINELKNYVDMDLFFFHLSVWIKSC